MANSSATIGSVVVTKESSVTTKPPIARGIEGVNYLSPSPKSDLDIG